MKIYKLTLMFTATEETFHQFVLASSPEEAAAIVATPGLEVIQTQW